MATPNLSLSLNRASSNLSSSTNASSFASATSPAVGLSLFQHPACYSQETYCDDETLHIRPKPEKVAVQSDQPCITIRVAAGKSPVPVSADRKNDIPCIVSLLGQGRSLEQVESERPGTDLVCVIDISGSMSGGKIAMVCDSLRFIVLNMTPLDRVSIVVFNNSAQRVSPLVTCTEEGRARLTSYIDTIRSNGGTNIASGLFLGLKVLEDRRCVNQVASVFLFSDGQDASGSRYACDHCKAVFLASVPKIAGGLSLHAFGFGSDHDSQLMSALAECGRGGYQYVEQTALIGSVFATSFGGVVSMVARDVEVRLNAVPSAVPCQVSHLYVRNRSDFFSIPAVTANEKKDLVFLLSILPSSISEPTTIKAVAGTVKYVTMEGVIVEAEFELNITVRMEDGKEAIDEDVYSNWYRVKGADVLHDAKLLADAFQFSQAQQLLIEAISELSNCPVAHHPTVIMLMEGMSDSLQHVSNAGLYNIGGSATISSLSSNHYYQTSSTRTVSYNSPQQVFYSNRMRQYQQHSMPTRLPENPCVFPPSTVPSQSGRNLQPPPSSPPSQ